MNEHVQRIIAELIGREGGYVNHPSDKGGPTNWGITQAVGRAFGYKGDMKDMPRATAEMIYEARYWQDPKFAVLYTFAPLVALELFDTGVNMGPGTAVHFLQRALNTLNLRGALYPELALDGRIGPMTRDAVRRLLEHRGTRPGQQVLVRLLDCQQGVRYMELAEKNQTQEDFIYGWVYHRIGNVEV